MGNHYKIQYCFRESVKFEHLQNLSKNIFSTSFLNKHLYDEYDLNGRLFLPHILFFILHSNHFPQNLELGASQTVFGIYFFTFFLFFLHSLSLLDLGTPQNGSCLGYLKLDHRHPLSIPLRRTTNNLLD